MSLRSPTANETALTLTLSHRNGRGDFRIFSYPRWLQPNPPKDGSAPDSLAEADPPLAAAGEGFSKEHERARSLEP
jgi:hypothetical protein